MSPRFALPLLLVTLAAPVSYADDGSDAFTTSAGTHFEADKRLVVQAPHKDLFAAGETVMLEGAVSDNAFAAGQTVEITGAVVGDLFAAGGTVILRGSVAGDAYVAGGTVELAPGARIGGDLFVAGASVSVDGSVGGDVLFGAANVGLHGSVDGDARGVAEGLSVQPGARVGGDLIYESGRQADVPDGVVAGAVRYTPSAPHDASWQPGPGAWIAGRLVRALWRIGTGFVAALLLGWLLWPLVPRLRSEVDEHPARSLGFGLTAVVAAPLLGLGGLMLVLPIPLLGFVATTLMTLMYLGRLLAADALGRWLLARSGQKDPAGWLPVLFGLALLGLAGLLPFLGWLAWFAAALVGLGAMLGRGFALRFPKAAVDLG